MNQWLKEGSGECRLLLAHGAGAPMDSEFMAKLSLALAGQGVQVWRFEFDYMAARRRDGRRRPPPRVPRLQDEFRDFIADANDGIPLFIGGKSMGGRVASLMAADRAAVQPDGVRGCLCFGYPFHPPAKPDRWRTDHFPSLRMPLWVGQGERDTFGSRPEVTEHLRAHKLDSRLVIEWLPDGDHDLKPPRRSDATWESNIALAASRAVAFMRRQGGG